MATIHRAHPEYAPLTRFMSRYALLPSLWLYHVAHSCIFVRYKVDILRLSGEEAVARIAETQYQDQEINAGQKILADFRKLELGRIALEYPPNLRRRSSDAPAEESTVSTSTAETKVSVAPTLPSLDIARGDYEGW